MHYINSIKENRKSVNNPYVNSNSLPELSTLDKLDVNSHSYPAKTVFILQKEKKFNIFEGYNFSYFTKSRRVGKVGKNTVSQLNI